MPATVDVRQLRFRYPGDTRLVLDGVDLALAAGDRCLLVGANGAGKTTLLHALAGRHIEADAAARVLGRPAFTDTSLAERVAFLGGIFPLDIDIGVDEILDRQPDVDPARRDALARILEVDRGWRMSRLSDGQRRRVQLLLGLMRPREVLLLDEITTDLDVIARVDLLELLREETESRGVTILYATHILDGMEAWATHVAHLHAGRIERFARIQDLPELAELQAARSPAPMMRLVEKWLRSERT